MYDHVSLQHIICTTETGNNVFPSIFHKRFTNVYNYYVTYTNIEAQSISYKYAAAVKSCNTAIVFSLQIVNNNNI